MNAEDIALTVHAHPTLGEMSMEAAEKAGLPIHYVIVIYKSFRA